MLMIRLQRKGKKHHAAFCLSVGEKRSKLKGKQLEELGWIDYGQNKSAFNKERILYWLKQGAKMSVTANNFLIDAKIVEGKKKPAHKISKKKEEKMAAAVEAKPAEAKV